ncbi:MAG: type IV pili methyl-accepting chemotaxis transducer N-terminal domain-containing protein [Proteobacteria bacterium]|nr:type IV pili methyl-accepting chemotaxis transducer N-terminal domain-containing protein [Pseudomonadota bacterium]
MFSKQVYNSVIFQILMAMMLIAGMALASMALAVYVTINSKDDAEAINLAGSLRMQSYRIANVLSRASEGDLADPKQTLAREAEAFSNKLYQSSVTQLVEESGNTPLQQSYRKVVSNWENGMAPLLPLFSDLGQEPVWVDIRQRYNQHLAAYVDDIELMVTHLQRNAEGKNELLGMTEGVSIILIVFILIFFVMKADSNFVVPLRGLVQAAEQVEKGYLAHRTSYISDNELGLLSQAFNSMTASLEAQYRNLEQQVSERTDKLRKSNLALNFLYKTSREIAANPNDLQLLNFFLADLKKVIEVEQINLFIKTEPDYPDYELISTAKDKASVSLEGCGINPGQPLNSGIRDVALALKNRNDEFGFLFVRATPGTELDSWQHQLLKTVAETLSTAFAFHRTLDQERRVILHEERSTIARELHDSLAQSLSYMKMEVARLKKMIAQGFEADQVEAAINDLQQGLNAAYKHLRELLATFRIKLDSPDLRSALEHAVEEFDQRSSAAVTLDYALGNYAMSPNQDIHILHILREALNNAVKHSGASNICLHCTRDDSGEVVFMVDDDGVGMPDNPEKQHHYGIYTMRERAQQLDGAFSCSSRPTGGTRVELKLKLAQANRLHGGNAYNADNGDNGTGKNV